jgi:hypothetical protein
MLATELLNCACLFPKRWQAAPQLPSPPPPTPQFSVVWDNWDLNGIPINPQWAEQRDTRQLPPVPNDENKNACVRQPNLKGQCTAQDALLDDQTPNLFWRAICAFVISSKIHGHVDWMPATYYGAVNWIHINFGDSDYNLRMFPYNGATSVENGLTLNNNNLNGTQYIEMEFDSNETSGRFGTKTWRDFDDAANELTGDAMKAWLDPQHHEDSPLAVVTGLFNLDCEHDCRSELHPVYAMAVERDSSPDDNNWAILVRNWGNGGSCSGYNQQLDLPQNQFNLVLPNTSGNPTVLWKEVEFAVSDKSIPFPKISFVSGQGLVLAFTLPDPEKRALVELALHLKWPKAKPAPARMKLAAARTVAVAGSESEVDPDSYVDALFAQVGEEPTAAHERLRSLAATAAKNEPVTPAAQAKIQHFRGPKKRIPKPGEKVAASKGVADPQKQSRDTALFQNLCAAYRNQGKQLPSDKVPDLPRLCASQ